MYLKLLRNKKTKQMKKYLFIPLVVLTSISLTFCGGSGGGDDPPPTPQPPVNKAPSATSQSEPTNNLLCIDNDISFKWSASTDPDGDTVSYEIQIATDNQITQNVQNFTSTTTSTSISLDRGVAYYWRIRAKDSKGATSSYSSIFNFYTEGDGVSNHLPFSPSIVTPNLNEVIQTTTTTLQWDASDVDTSDTLTFDVYFDTVNPPTTIVSENQTTKTFDTSLESAKTYYWKVVVKDDKGGITIGQVWSFKTD